MFYCRQATTSGDVVTNLASVSFRRATGTDQSSAAFADDNEDLVPEKGDDSMKQPPLSTPVVGALVIDDASLEAVICGGITKAMAAIRKVQKGRASGKGKKGGLVESSEGDEAAEGSQYLR